MKTLNNLLFIFTLSHSQITQNLNHTSNDERFSNYASSASNDLQVENEAKE
jgi:hypothetical protein